MLNHLTTLLANLSPALVLDRGARVLLILFGGWLLLNLGGRIIRRAFAVARVEPGKRETLVTLVSSLVRYLVYAVAALLLIKVFVPDFDLAPILAGAGVLGLAVGFGAQSLIKDVVTGFFINFEDQLHVGDYVQLNDGVTGTVEEVGLRMTTIREWGGQKYYIANSEIRTVRNYNRRELRAIVAATFPFEEDPRRVHELLDEVCAVIRERHADGLLRDENGEFVEPPQVYGVTDISRDERGGEFTIIAKTTPEAYWAVQRAIREEIWVRARERGIALAYPRRVLEDRCIKPSGRRQNEDG
ncbi:MAG: mechanosensitive ion channel family protein [Thermoanaerobacterales bacterium]|nr:mechanosensitive ion channel family protein [Thermoanaerobacterales bacterium]